MQRISPSSICNEIGRRIQVPDALEWAARGRKEVFQQIGFIPNPGWQEKFIASDARFKITHAGAQSGKSYTFAHDVLPDLLTPNRVGWIVAPTYELGAKEFGYIYERLVNQLRLPTSKHVFNPDSGNMFLEFPWDSWVKVKSAKYPDSLQAEALNFMIVAEPAGIERRIWDSFLRARLTTRKGRAIIGGTAISLKRLSIGIKWFKEMAARGRSSLDKWREWKAFHGSTSENPYNLENEEQMREELTEAMFRAVWGGEFIAYVGLVFRDEWDHDENVITQEEAEKLYAKAHRRIGVVDWGYRNPAVLNPLGIHPEYIVQPAEWYERGKTIDQIIDQSLKMQRKWNIEGWICDPEEPGYIQMFIDHGLRAIAGNNAVIPGLDCVRRHIKRRNPEGRRSFIVSENCTNTIWEAEEGYRYPEKKEEAIAGADKPIDANNHAWSANRYGAYTLEAGPKSVGTVQRVVVSDVERVRIGEGEF